ncbi:hypothetical protein GCM10009795_039210 [Nocardioides hankookensis]|uniref:Lipoprotein n=1 Tax=Nocardioides hankookensis TaxID=443157 RepID=A0ABW1LRP7_9ACTN
MRRAVGGLVLLGLLAGLSGCREEPPHVLEAGGAYVVVGSDPDQGEDAAIVGEVELVGDCLGIDGDVVFWPRGTEVVSTDPVVIAVPDVGRVGIGDRVSGGGGEHEGRLTEPVVPATCPDGYVTFRAG